MRQPTTEGTGARAHGGTGTLRGSRWGAGIVRGLAVALGLAGVGILAAAL